MREWDLYTLQAEPITSINLMERAALNCTTWVLENGFGDKPIKIFCAKGNNGGDGLAIARQLEERKVETEVYILEFGIAGTADFQTNLQKIHQHTSNIHFIQSETLFPAINAGDVVIDALYGTGLNRPLSGLSAALAKHINQSAATVISIDIPSGMFGDISSGGNPVIKAHYTLTFQAMKLAFLLPENDEYIGEVEIFDIGLHPAYARDTFTPYEYTDAALIKSLYKPRNKFAHKGTMGHCLIIAGSKGTMGACILASKACLRAGSGLVTAAVSESDIPVIQVAFPEAMALSIEQPENLEPGNYSAIGMGPGLGNNDASVLLMSKILEKMEKPMVLDADAINILSQNQKLLRYIPGRSIFTPHPKEFERLFGSYDNQFERLKGALENAKSLQCYIIIKGHYTFIASPGGKGYFNSTGNPGMATAGSGDVLTGIITSLLGQAYAPLEAVVLGVYLHGLAGNLSVEKLSQESLIASDIIEGLSGAFKAVSKY